MLWLTLTALASETDAHPGVFSAAAAPIGRAQLDVGAGALATIQQAPVAAIGRLSVALGPRFQLDAFGFVGEVKPGFSIGSSPPPEPHADAAIRFGVALVAEADLRVVAYVGSGTVTQVGAAVWWRSAGRRWEFDAAWGPSLRTAPLFGLDGRTWANVSGRSAFRWDVVTGMPELGVTWNLGPNSGSHLRFGHWGPVPRVGYRMSTGSTSLEVSAGTLIAVWGVQVSAALHL